MRLLFLAALLLASIPAARCAEKVPAEKAPAEVSVPATPEAMVEQLQTLLTEDDTSGSEKEVAAQWKRNMARVETIIAAFRKQFPDHPLRWEVLYWEANSNDVREELGLPRLPNLKPTTEVYAEIANAEAAPKETRAKASADRLMLLSADVSEKKLTLPDWEKLAQEHYTRFPDYELNPMLHDGHASFVEEFDPPRYIPFLEALTKNPNADVATMAEQKLVVAREREILKSKPLELKFKALDGVDFDMEKLRGKVVLLQFWATWCGPCMEELPAIQQTYTKLHDKGFEIVAISLDDDEKELRAVLKKKKITWTQHFDGKGWDTALAKRFGVDGIPALWLLNKQGMVVDMKATEGLAEKVEKLLAE